MRQADWACVVAAALALALLVSAWAVALHEGWRPEPHLWRNAYLPFSVEASIRDR